MNTLAAFSQSDSLATTKIALLTFYGARYPDWSEKILVLLEYLQLISQSLLMYPSATNQTSSSNSDFTKAVIYFFKLVNPSTLLTFHDGDSTTYIILLIILCSMLLKYLLAAYIVYIAYRNREGNSWLLSIWRWVFRRQGRILYFFISSFWTYLILNCSAGTFTIDGMGNEAIIAISSILIAIEYTFSVILELRFSYVLPTKNFISAKSCRTAMITLNQKLIAQLVQLTCQESFGKGIWVFILFNFTLNLIRDYHYYTVFPLYNFKALLFQGSLLSMVASMNIACLFHNILQEADYQGENVNFIVIVWIILSLLAGKLSGDYLQRQNTNLIARHSKVSVDKLLHKMFTMKELKKWEKLPGKRNKKYDARYLICISEEINLQNIFNFAKMTTPDLIKNENYNKVYLQYLEHLSARSPHKSLIQLHIARLCSKDPGLYPKAINIITKLTQKRRSECLLSAWLLQYEIEKRIMKSHTSDESTLDLTAYIKNQINIDKLTDDMLKQTELKITICNNILEEKSNIGLIFGNAQLINKYKLGIQKQIDLLPQTLPNCFIEPYLICAGYYRALYDSLEAYEKYNNIYLQKHSKFEKTFQELKLNNENLYQDTNTFLILSGEKSNHGKIVYYSNAIANICGGKYTYIGTHISTLFMPSYQHFLNETLKQIFETGEDISNGKRNEVFLHHKSGYMINGELFVKIHPYLTQGVYLNVILRPFFSSKEHLILKEDGTIEGITKKLAYDLGIKATLPHIKVLSEELWSAIKAFNIIVKRQAYKSEELSKLEESFEAKSDHEKSLIDFQNALSLYHDFSGVKRLGLKSVRQSTPCDLHFYDCTISIKSIGTTSIKIITLEKANKGDTDQNDDNTDRSIDRQEQRDYKMTRRKTEDQRNKDKKEEIDSNDSENIDSPEDIADDRLINVCRPEIVLTTNENLLSPKSDTQTNRPFLFTNRDAQNIQNQIVKPTRVLTKGMDEKHGQIPPINMNSISNQQPKPSSHNKSIFKSAIEINFHPKSFTATCLTVYAVILITLLSQVVLKIVSDDIMATLTVKKNLLTYSQLRSFKVILIAVNSRVGITTITSRSLDQGTIIYDLPTTVSALYNHSQELKDYNKKMIDYTSSLDRDIQQKLFAKDIRVFEYQMDDFEDPPYHSVTQFEVINEVVEKIEALQSLSDPGSHEAFRLFYWVHYNLINDFLYKYQEIVSLFAQTLKNEKEYLQTVIMLCLAIIPVLLVAIVLIVAGIIWKQYKIEKRNMLAFIRLKPATIKENLSKLKSFQKNLQNKDYREYQKPIEHEDEPQVLPRDEPQRNNRKRQNNQGVNYSETRTRYYGYLGKVIFYVMILIGITVLNFVTANNATKIIYKKQSQIHFANSIADAVGLQYTAFQDAFTSNNTANITHSLPVPLMYNGIEKLKELQSQTPDMFLEIDGTYDPQIQSLLYKSFCNQFTFNVTLYRSYCNLLFNKGYQVNLISMINLQTVLMEAKRSDYENCNQTDLNSLFVCAYKNVNFFAPAFALTIAESLSVGDIIATKLYKSISDANHERNVFLIVFSVSLVVASLLIWHQILGKLKEGYNDFKKVLQLFPPSLILSSFQLKRFLLQHSKQIQKDQI